MSKQYPGGIVSKTPVTPTSLSAPGVWTLNQQAAAQATNTWPFPRDPQFNYVTMLLHGDGSAGPVATGAGAGASPVVTNFNADASTNNFNVTINGDAKSNNFNPYLGDGYYSNLFNGSSGLSCNVSGISAGTSTFTFEAWVFLTSLASDSVLFDTRSSNGASTTGMDFAVYATTGNIKFYDGTETNLGGTVTVNVWTHIALVRNSSNVVTAYINGTATGTTVSSTRNFSDNYFWIASVPGPAAPYVVGNFSNLRWVVGTAVYTSNFTPSTTPLTAITNTKLLTCQSNRFIDNSTNAYTITVNGTPSVSPAIPFTLPTTVATYGSGYFDGTGDYLTIADNAALELSTSSFTMEWWSYPTTFASNQFQLSKCATSASTEGFLTYINTSGVLKFNANSVSAWDIANDQGTLALKLNAWNHCAISRSGSSWRMWVNGVSSVTITSALGVQNTSTAYSIAGAANGSAPFLGYMTDTRIVIGSYVYDPASSTITIPTTPLTAVTYTQLLTTQYNGGGNNSGFKDSSQFNFPITRNGNTTQGTFTPYGSNWSNYFNGSSYLSVANNANLNLSNSSFTIELWVYGTGTYPQGLISKGTTTSLGSEAWSIEYTSASGGIAFGSGAYNSWSSAMLTGTITLNAWNHVAVVRNVNAHTMYINGVSASTLSASYTVTNAGTLYVGTGWYAPSSRIFSAGYISNVRLVIGTAVYTSAFTPSTTPLTAITNTQLLTCQSNRFVDNSSNAFAVSITSAPTVQRFSPFAPLTVYNPTTYGGSGYFDGSGDYLVAAYNAAFNFGTGPFTIETWFYSTANNTYQAIVGIHNGDAGWILRVDSGLRVMFYTGSAEWFGAITMPINTWNHIAIVREGTGTNQTKMYVNGVLDQSMTLTANYTQTNQLSIGAQQNNLAGTYLNGWMSNLRVVKNSAVYTSAFTPSTTPLTAVTNTSLLLNYTNPAILDNSMMNNLETVGNAAVSTSVKKYGTASMVFDGTGDYLSTPDNPALDMGSASFTIEGWVYVTATSVSLQTLVAKGTGANNQASYHIALNGSTWVYYLSGTGSSWSIASGVTIGTYTINTWQHIALVRNGSTFTPYLNGVAGTTTTSSTALFDSNKPFTAGADDAGTSLLTGYIDELRVTKGVARYTTTFTVPDQAFPNG